MRLYQPKEGYCYNSDSIILYGFINSFAPRGKLLDVGAGCGIVGLLVARDNERVELFGVEKQDAFIGYIKKNAEENGIGYTLFHQDFLQMEETKQFDYIVSNPPFYHDGASRSENEMLRHARYGSSLPMKSFFEKVYRLLTPKGHFVFCYDAKQFVLVAAALEAAKLRATEVRFVHSKTTKKASLVLLHVRKNAKSLVHVLPPLFSFIDGAFSPELQNLYEKAATKSVKCHLS
jgi:tRNA1Val (adenine37-N6)-methyltransferase